MVKTMKLGFVLSELKVRYLNGNKCAGLELRRKVKARASDVGVTR